ncbi:MAG TPA: ABC transporter permease [Egibacteraceae bacterium]|jgi:peptide/nickel transport system permease protein|nr:ABC transporter permease [Egibacteraceae bacterium]
MSRLLTEVRRSPLLAVGVVVVTVLATVAVLAPYIAPFDPKAIVGNALEEPSSRHLLGTNDAGADIFSELVWGARSTLVVAASATALVLAIGVLLGLVAGLRGGVVETLVMRSADVVLAIPAIPLLIFIASMAGPSRTVAIVSIGLLGWPQVARVVRSQTLSLRNRGFVHAARGYGADPLFVMRRHLLPALGPIIAANLAFMAGLAVTIEAGLAFIGLGDPTTASWGAILERALRHQAIYVTSMWVWWLLPAGLAITVAVLGFTFIGVGLEPRFNPRWTRFA